jgi:hypothetical protein
MSEGFVKLNRGLDAEDLLRDDPNAFLLLTWIALRARRRAGPNKYDLKPGQAMVGDYAQIGFTRQPYRTALANLQKYGYLTINPTKRGTIVTIANTAVYDINGASFSDVQPSNQPTTNQQVNQRATNDQPTANQQLTTNKKERRKECKKERILPAQNAGEEEPSEHRLLIETWSDAFKAHFESTYGFSGGRDAKAVKTLLHLAGSPEAVMEIATAAWSNLSGFLHQQASTLHGLAERWNEIQVAVKTGMKSATKIRSNLRPVGVFTKGGDVTEEFKRMTWPTK